MQRNTRARLARRDVKRKIVAFVIDGMFEVILMFFLFACRGFYKEKKFEYMKNFFILMKILWFIL